MSSWQKSEAKQDCNSKHTNRCGQQKQFKWHAKVTKKNSFCIISVIK